MAKGTATKRLQVRRHQGDLELFAESERILTNFGDRVGEVDADHFSHALEGFLTNRSDPFWDLGIRAPLHQNVGLGFDDRIATVPRIISGVGRVDVDGLYGVTATKRSVFDVRERSGNTDFPDAFATGESPVPKIVQARGKVDVTEPVAAIERPRLDGLDRIGQLEFGDRGAAEGRLADGFGARMEDNPM